MALSSATADFSAPERTDEALFILARKRLNTRFFPDRRLIITVGSGVNNFCRKAGAHILGAAPCTMKLDARLEVFGIAGIESAVATTQDINKKTGTPDDLLPGPDGFLHSTSSSTRHAVSSRVSP